MPTGDEEKRVGGTLTVFFGTSADSSGQRDEGHDDDQGTAPDTVSEAATVTSAPDRA